MLHIWRRSPMLRLFLPFAMGVLMEIQWSLPLYLVISSIVASLIFFLLVLRRSDKFQYYFRHIPGILFMVIFLCSGVLFTKSVDVMGKNDYYIHHVHDEYFLMVKLLDAPVSKEKSVKVLVNVFAVYNDSVFKNTSGKLLLYLQKDSLAEQLKVDDELCLSGAPNAVSSTKNPFEFDYRKYLSHHQIHIQQYVKPNEWKLTTRPESHSFIGFFISIREDMLNILKSYNIDEREYAVLSALVLGKTTEMDGELLNAYASAGVIHVLAVSGLHVALIYIILAPLLKLIFPKNKRKLVKSIVPILMLWMYAGVTGFSPSVLRAALMFTCFILAENYQKENNIYNTLCSSALILLCYQPYMLMEVGFQLSYLAVLGIVVMQKPMVNLLYFENKLLRWAWKLTAVSLSAQITTLPLTLYYFHQFPTYCLVANLMVIPLSTVVLYVALSFFALAWWCQAAELLANISALLTRVMNDLMVFIDLLPGSVIQGIAISVPEAIGISGLCISCSYWLLWRKPSALILSLTLLLLLAFSQLAEKKNQMQRTELCIHQIAHKTCISFVSGCQSALMYDKQLIDDPAVIRFHLKAYWSYLGIDSMQMLNLDDTLNVGNEVVNIRHPFVQAGKWRFAFLNAASLVSMKDLFCDCYIVDEKSKDLFLDKNQLSAFSGKTLLMTDGVSKKRKQFLLSSLPKDAKVFDLSDGAVILDDHGIQVFSEKYR